MKHRHERAKDLLLGNGQPLVQQALRILAAFDHRVVLDLTVVQTQLNPVDILWPAVDRVGGPQHADVAEVEFQLGQSVIVDHELRLVGLPRELVLVDTNGLSEES